MVRKKKPDIDDLKLQIYARACRTALTAAAGVGAIIGKFALEHSERVYSAMHFLVFGRLP